MVPCEGPSRARDETHLNQLVTVYLVWLAGALLGREPGGGGQVGERGRASRRAVGERGLEFALGRSSLIVYSLQLAGPYCAYRAAHGLHQCQLVVWGPMEASWRGLMVCYGSTSLGERALRVAVAWAAEWRARVCGFGPAGTGSVRPHVLRAAAANTNTKDNNNNNNNNTGPLDEIERKRRPQFCCTSAAWASWTAWTSWIAWAASHKSPRGPRSGFFHFIASERDSRLTRVGIRASGRLEAGPSVAGGHRWHNWPPGRQTRANEEEKSPIGCPLEPIGSTPAREPLERALEIVWLVPIGQLVATESGRCLPVE